MSENNTTSAADAHLKKRRNARLGLLGGVVMLAAIGSTAYWELHAVHFVSTDNAYAAAEVAQITPAVGGTVLEVKVSDTQAVKEGDVLLVIDPTDAKLAVAQATAELDRATRRVKSYMANDNNLSAQISAREADAQRASAQLAAAQADFERAKVDLQRRQALHGGFATDGFVLAQRGQLGAPLGGDLVHALTLLRGPAGFGGGAFLQHRFALRQQLRHAVDGLGGLFGGAFGEAAQVLLQRLANGLLLRQGLRAQRAPFLLQAGGAGLQGVQPGGALLRIGLGLGDV